MGDRDSKKEIARLKALLAATEELLAVHEQAVAEQSDKLESTFRELLERQRQLEAMTEKLEFARDQALQASEMKSQFLANMSHEIRTPISSVIGMTELLLDSDLDQQQKRFATIIQQSAESLLTIINDILDFSKMEAGKIELSPTCFSPRELVQGCVELMAPAARQKQLTMTIDYDPDIPESLVADPARLRQVLVNLLSNAVKFTEHGAVVLKTELSGAGDGRVVVKFTVSDTGIGLSDNARRRLFTPFTQADGTTTRRFGGTGLGLSISKHLVELMGGEIGFESQAGAGSTFWFVVPLAAPGPAVQSAAEQAAAAAAAKRTAPGPPLPDWSGKHLVLVAEDNPVLMELAIRQLHKLGVRAEGVATGREAVRAASEKEYAVVLMDCQMPDMDGYSATRAIREEEQGSTRHIPIIAMTAAAMASDRKACLEAGMDDFLAKPVSTYSLSQVLGRWLEK